MKIRRGRSREKKMTDLERRKKPESANNEKEEKKIS
jgi:hypothetical protein